jgi:hypothetical protein
MRMAIPHGLGKDEALRRIKSRAHEIADFVPSLAEVQTGWPREDRMELQVAAMGQAIAGTIDVAETEVVFAIALPGALSFVEPMVRAAIEAKGRKLLT